MFGLFNSKPKKVSTKGDFMRLVRFLHKENPQTPITDRFDDDLISKYGDNQSGISHKNQGEHWIGWLNGYKGAGFYNRKDNKRSPEYIYNHVMCPQMIVWLAEVSGLTNELLDNATKEALKSEKYQTQCAVLRKHISWSKIMDSLDIK
jgi:hypothetical protein